MAKYTMELRELFTPIRFNPPLFTKAEVEGWFKDYELSDYLTEEEIEVITDAGIWSKDKLASLIVDHYYMRELGFETPMLFKHYAKIEMQEIMEEYLPLIYSASIKYNPLNNEDYEESLERELGSSGSTTSGSESSSSSSGSSLGVNSDTPEGQISKTAILNGTYATSTGATESENSVSDETSSETSREDSTSETYTKTIKGLRGATYQKMISQYRDNIRAINREIIKKVGYLFMGLY